VDENNVVTIGDAPTAPGKLGTEPLSPQFEVTETEYIDKSSTRGPAIDLETFRREAEADKAQAVVQAKAQVWAEIEVAVRAELTHKFTAEAKGQAEQLVADARTQAGQMLTKASADAQIQAVQLIADATGEVEALRAQAMEEGRAQGIADAQAEADSIIAAADAELQAAKAYKKQMMTDIEPQVIELILKVLDNIIGTQKELNPQLISLLIAQGIDSLTGAEEIAVHVSPDDYELVDKDQIMAGMETMAELTFVKDPTLSKGNCIINTPLGSVDCGLDTQYNGIKRNLDYILRNR